MKYILLLLTLLVTSCNSKRRYEPREEIVGMPADSLQDIMEFISYVDSSGIVEQVSNDFVELKETNEKLETTLEETKQELHETRKELVETQVILERTEEVVRAITDSIGIDSKFELLPIKK